MWDRESGMRKNETLDHRFVWGKREKEEKKAKWKGDVIIATYQ